MNNRGRAISSFGITLVVMLGFTLYLFFNFKTVVVSGESMLPTFKDGSRLLVSNAYWLVGPIKDKDIVVVRENNTTGYIIKRVYKLPNETVDWYNIPKKWSLLEGEYKVPQGTLYILGDNREVSEDSRSFGPVDVKRVLGKVVIR